MATNFTIANGNWSAPGTWFGGAVPTVPVGASIFHTVTIDQNINVGDDTAAGGIQIQAGGKLEVLNTVAANYTLTVRGDLVVLNGGTLEIGTVANPIPIARTFTIKLNDSAALANVKYGLKVNSGGTMTVQGAALAFDRSFMSVNGAIGDNHIHTADNTGWLAGDTIVIASTGYAADWNQYEVKILSVNAAGDTVTNTTNLANAHSGTAPTRAEVANLTRNIIITASNVAFYAFILIGATAVVDVDWCLFGAIGSSTASKHGLEMVTTTGSVSINRCAFNGWTRLLVYMSGAALNNVAITNTIFGPMVVTAGSPAVITIVDATPNVVSVTDCLFIGQSGLSYVCDFGDIGLTFQRNTITSSNFATIQLLDSATTARLGTWEGLVFHSNTGTTLVPGTVASSFFPGGTIENSAFWRNDTLIGATAGQGPFVDLLFKNCSFIAVSVIAQWFPGTNTYSPNVRFQDCRFADDTGGGSQCAIRLERLPILDHAYMYDNCTFGKHQGIEWSFSDNDIWYYQNGLAQIRCRNCYFDAGGAVGVIRELDWTTPGYLDGSYLESDQHNQVNGQWARYERSGSVTRDDIYFLTVAPSQRLTPQTAAHKLSSGGKQIGVQNGVARTVKVNVRQSSVAAGGANYNGALPRLIYRRNIAIGIAADTVADTAAVGLNVWDELTAVLPAPTDDGIIEVYVDCDGTTGFVNVDKWSVV